MTAQLLDVHHPSLRVMIVIIHHQQHFIVGVLGCFIMEMLISEYVFVISPRTKKQHIDHLYQLTHHPVCREQKGQILMSHLWNLLQKYTYVLAKVSKKPQHISKCSSYTIYCVVIINKCYVDIKCMLLFLYDVPRLMLPIR